MRKPSLSILSQPAWPELNEIGVSINSIANAKSILKSYKNLNRIKFSKNSEILERRISKIYCKSDH